MDVAAGKMLTLGTHNGSAKFHDFPARPGSDLIAELIDPFAALLDQEEALSIKSTKQLESRFIDGRRVSGLAIEFEHQSYHSVVEMVIWADEDTNLPVLIETLWWHNEAEGQIGEHRSAPHMTVVLEDFEYDVSLDPEDFLLEIPSTYRTPASAANDR